MTRRTTVQAAIEAIGESGPEDWIIDPRGHAKALELTAPELAKLLDLEPVKISAEQYNDADYCANAAQKGFKSPAMRANVFVFLTVLVGALMTIAGTVLVSPPDVGQANGQPDLKWLFLGLAIAGVVTGALASMFLNQVREDTRLAQWMNQRAEAEHRRLEYFDVVREVGTRKDPELELQKLEYHRRYLLDSQRAFFEKRAREHSTSGRRSLSFSLGATAAALILTSSAGILAAEDSRWAALAALGVIVTALGAAAATRETIHQDRRNAKRYDATRNQLNDLKKKLEDVRNGVLAGDNTVHDDFANATRSVLMEEHAQWLDTAKQRNAALEQLDKRLKEHLKRDETGT